MLVPAAALAVVGTIVTAVVSGLAAAWLFDLTTLEGMLLGSILASTDGAAVFSILRGSTLRRRLARTLEGEAGFNDPVAVLLVLGFIDWIQKPDYGIADMAVLFVEEIGIGLVVGPRGRRGRRCTASGDAACVRRPLSGRVAGDRRSRVRRRRRAARLRLPRRLHRRSGARIRADPGQAHDHHLP